MTAPQRIDLSALDTLHDLIDAMPDFADGIDLVSTKQTALIQLAQLTTTVSILRKLTE